MYQPGPAQARAGRVRLFYMEYTRLGKTDLMASRIGFGCWAIGGHGWGRVDDEESIRSIRRALELGVNLFDTADVYGLGHSEEVLRRGLGEDRKRVVIATKFGLRWDSEARITRDISPQRVTEALEGSLRRLDIDAIPLYFIHGPDNSTPIEATMGALVRCQESGKVLHIGCSNLPLETVRRARAISPVTGLQSSYNIVDRTAEQTVIPFCRELGISLITFSSLAQGLLTGKYGSRVAFGEQDIRKRSQYFAEERAVDNMEIVMRTAAVARRLGVTPAQVALRWLLDNPHVACALTGIKRSGQIEENAGATGWELDDAAIETLTPTLKAQS